MGKIIIKRGWKAGIAMAAAVSLITAGCSGQKHTDGSALTAVSLSEREKAIASLAGDMMAVVHLERVEDSASGSLYLEEWLNGERIRSDLLSQGEGPEDQDYYIVSETVKDEDGSWMGTRWKLMYEGDGVKTVTGDLYTDFPEGKTARMEMNRVYGEDGEGRTDLKAGGNYILAVRCFQFDRDSMRSIDLKGMETDDTMFGNYDYVVLVRLVAA